MDTHYGTLSGVRVATHAGDMATHLPLLSNYLISGTHPDDCSPRDCESWVWARMQRLMLKRIGESFLIPLDQLVALHAKDACNHADLSLPRKKLPL